MCSRTLGNWYYLQSIVSVRFAIQISGRLMQKSYPANDIKLWGKKLVKQVTLSDLTVLYGNEFHVQCARPYLFPKSQKIIQGLSGISSIITIPHYLQLDPFLFRTTEKTISDFEKAADLYKEQGNKKWYQNSLDRLKELRNNEKSLNKGILEIKIFCFKWALFHKSCDRSQRPDWQLARF